MFPPDSPLMWPLQDKKWPNASVAEVVLIGHKDIAQFPLATSSAAPMVASGGTDKLVLLWDLNDVIDGILTGRNVEINQPSTQLEARCVWVELRGTGLLDEGWLVLCTASLHTHHSSAGKPTHHDHNCCNTLMFLDNHHATRLIWLIWFGRAVWGGLIRMMERRVPAVQGATGGSHSNCGRCCLPAQLNNTAGQCG